MSDDEKRRPSLGPIAAVQGAGARPIPKGASIDPITGVFRWTPTEAQGPGKYPITVRVTDNGAPPMSVEQSFTVTVNEVNSAPKLSAVSDQSVEVGRELTFAATATDSDLPPNVMTFALGPSAPDGAKLTPTGVFTWTPTEAQGGASYPILITVTDDGTPPLSDGVTFNVAVASVPPREIRVTGTSLAADGKFTFTWSAQAGRSYQVQFKRNLADLEWTNIEPPVTAVGEAGVFTASVNDGTQHYFRVMLER